MEGNRSFLGNWNPFRCKVSIGYHLYHWPTWISQKTKGLSFPSGCRFKGKIHPWFLTSTKAQLQAKPHRFPKVVEEKTPPRLETRLWCAFLPSWKTWPSWAQNMNPSSHPPLKKREIHESFCVGHAKMGMPWYVPKRLTHQATKTTSSKLTSAMGSLNRPHLSTPTLESSKICGSRKKLMPPSSWQKKVSSTW